MSAPDKDEAHRRLIARLHQQAEDVRRLTSGLDEAQLAARPVPDKWSLKELVCHLERIQEIFESRVEAMVAQDEPAIVSYQPEDDPEFPGRVARPAESALDGFRDGRARLAARLEGLSPAAWHRRGSHPEYPHYDVHFAVEYMVHHEAHHVFQMFHRRSLLGKMPH